MDLKCNLRSRLFLFVCACLAGVLCALIWRSCERKKATIFRKSVISKAASLHDTSYPTWLNRQGFKSLILPEEQLLHGKNRPRTESDFLFEKISVLCLVRCKSSTGAKAVKDTWSKHCNRVLFWGEFLDDKIPVVRIDETVRSLTRYVWKKFNGKFDWVLAVDDHTFAIVENLRQYVAPLNSSGLYYLGHPAQDYSTVYNLEEAGIALSWGTFEMLASYNRSSAETCSEMGVCLGRVLNDLRVPLVDTRDKLLRGRFNPFLPEDMIIPGSISIFSSYWRSSLFLSSEGKDCCSDLAITFRGISPVSMYLMEYVIYSLSVYRNSPLGLANHPPNYSATPNRKQNAIEGNEEGKPIVKLLSSTHSRKNLKLSKMSKGGSFSKFWNELFNS